MFRVKDEVVYPGQGVAIIEEIIDKSVGSENIKFMRLSFKYKDMTMLLPISRAKASGLRPVSNYKEIEKALAELGKSVSGVKKLRDFMPAGWSKRQKEYQSKLESGQLCDVAVAYRDLKWFSEAKELSFGEKSLMLMAEDLLSQEILSATKMNYDQVIKSIRGGEDLSAGVLKGSVECSK